MENEYTVIGKPSPIGDLALKVTEQKIYVGDMELPGMLCAKVLLSTVSQAGIKSIDTSAAEALPGVKAVAAYKNTPQVRYNSAVRFIEHKNAITYLRTATPPRPSAMRPSSPILP